jgi:hypothetical protein
MKGVDLIKATQESGAHALWRGDFSPSPGKQLSLAKDMGLVTYKSLDEALFAVRPSVEPFEVRTVRCADGKSQCALAAARVKAAPYETLLITLQKVKGRWKIERFWPYVDH